MRNAVIHKLKKGGQWRVVDVPEGFDEDRDLFPDHESSRLHDTEEQAIADWKERLGLTPASED